MPLSSVAPDARSRIADVDGPVHYLDFGGPAGAPVVVGLHGLGGSHLNWLAVGPRLSRRVRLLAIDQVGHGLTPTTPLRHADMEGHRRLVDGFLKTVVGSPAILMGNSMGGLVAALQAAADPGSVSGLILIDPALPTARLGLVHPRVVANFMLCSVPGVGERYLTQRRRRTTAEQTVRRVLDVCCVDSSRVPEDVVAEHIALTERIDRSRADAAYLDSARSLSMVMARPTGTITKLSRIDQPTLLLQGARDVLVPLAAAHRMHSAHPEWRFEVASDIGHVPMLEAPEWSAARIEEWLADRQWVAGSTEESVEPVS